MYGRAIADARERAGLTRAELERRSGVGATTIRNWEIDNCDPCVYYAVKVADVLGLSLDELIGRVTPGTVK